jgi:hypothetical protein
MASSPRWTEFSLSFSVNGNRIFKAPLYSFFFICYFKFRSVLEVSTSYVFFYQDPENIYSPCLFLYVIPIEIIQYYFVFLKYMWNTHTHTHTHTHIYIYVLLSISFDSFFISFSTIPWDPSAILYVTLTISFFFKGAQYSSKHIGGLQFFVLCAGLLIFLCGLSLAHKPRSRAYLTVTYSYTQFHQHFYPTLQLFAHMYTTNMQPHFHESFSAFGADYIANFVSMLNIRWCLSLICLSVITGKVGLPSVFLLAIQISYFYLVSYLTRMKK